MSKKRICFIAQFPPPMHGLSKAVETLYESDLSQEFDFEKIDITNNKRIIDNLTKVKKSKADLFYFTISQTKSGNLRDLMIFKAIGNRPCLVHLHGGYYKTMVENLPTWQRKKNYKAISKLSGTIVLGPSLKWIFEGMIPSEKIITVPNCVDDEYLMSDEEFEKKIKTFPERKVKHVVYLSNFIKSKGYPEVLELAKLEKECDGERRFHFDFAGGFFEKSEEDFFWTYIKDNELQEYITYHGVVSGEKKQELLKQGDVFILLTKYPKEGQPISILEAMGNGMVIVTTAYAGIPDIVKNDENGLLVRGESVSEIYNRISQISEADYSQTVRNNRMKIQDYYTESQYLSNMERVFKEILYEKQD